MKTRTQRIGFSALLAALACVATMIIRIPSPLNGYLNLGLLSGILPVVLFEKQHLIRNLKG